MLGSSPQPLLFSVFVAARVLALSMHPHFGSIYHRPAFLIDHDLGEDFKWRSSQGTYLLSGLSPGRPVGSGFVSAIHSLALSSQYHYITLCYSIVLHLPTYYRSGGQGVFGGTLLRSRPALPGPRWA